jgi:hypothetical protein
MGKFRTCGSITDHLRIVYANISLNYADFTTRVNFAKIPVTDLEKIQSMLSLF